MLQRQRIDTNIFCHVMPGMLTSACTLQNKASSEGDNENVQVFGSLSSAIFLTAHCAELLLKYKIEQEGGTNDMNTHHLHDLYNRLSNSAKEEIEQVFNELSQSLQNRQGSEPQSAKSVFQQADNSCQEWRYIVEERDTELSVSPRALFVATASVYVTIPILRDMAIKQLVGRIES